jgi:5-bromo-4-chloroindolyl phosphate hydrolysis protein
MNNYNNAYRQGKAALKPTKFAVPVGQVSGTLFTVFGIIGSTVFGIGVIVLTLLGYLIGSRGVFHTIAMGLLPLFITSIILCMNGSRIRKRLKRFQRYISQMRGRSYCLIKDFSSATGLSNKSTVKDLRKMIAIGMFPEGRIDDKKTCFMLNNECYEQYLKLQEDVKMKDLEEQEKQKNQTTNQDFIQEEKNNKNDSLKPEIRKAIDEGRQFVMEIKDANIAIPGEEISRKLDRLEEVTRKIFDYVEIHPEKFPEIKKFTEYFLPTTLKLVDAYRKLDYQPVQGENISSAKKEIEETMDTINLAFENLLDGLFEDVAMDISTDISVLETMFAQEGLTEKNMRVKNKTMEDKK